MSPEKRYRVVMQFTAQNDDQARQCARSIADASPYEVTLVELQEEVSYFLKLDLLTVEEEIP